jgi:molybdopterin converting factor subunit 1
MKLMVKYFAVAADIAKRRDEPLELPEGATVKELLDQLERRYPGLHRLRPSLRVAVEQEYGTDGTPLRDGDEVAILPPVCGG